ncbi:MULTISPECIES: hypothetical protein [unclassified Flavobacterium]|uniref:hypothetical protein n=1 Tax=unclassified Flavobacterium TaxID=196869 RepID=UPI00131CEC46|nr:MULTISPECIES: hypothetical protein [unclassified Flavobacterium]
MEINKIETLLEKYFEGVTTITEENELRSYFSSGDVAQHLIQYQHFFKGLNQSKKEQFTRIVPFYRQIRPVLWLSIAASVIVAVGVGSYAFLNTDTTPPQSDLGTYEDPKVAFEATQKALSLLSNNINVGIESVLYLEEYQIAKNKVFKKPVRKQGS